MIDPISVGSRAAAERLVPQYGARLVADVEAALHPRAPAQYDLDPVSLGSLIVSIATLAWTIYNDLKKKTPTPPPDIVVRTVRRKLRKRDDTGPVPVDQLTEVVVTEVIRAAGDSS